MGSPDLTSLKQRVAEDRDAIRAAHKLFEDAQVIAGQLVIPAATVLGWTLGHAAAINHALREQTNAD